MSPACLSPHPLDYGPIVRRCHKPPGHEGLHGFRGFGDVGVGEEWGGEG